MSTINVDNIAEYTSSGKINATHDIKMASGKSVLNSDGYSNNLANAKKKVFSIFNSHPRPDIFK